MNDELRNDPELENESNPDIPVRESGPVYTPVDPIWRSTPAPAPEAAPIPEPIQEPAPAPAAETSPKAERPKKTRKERRGMRPVAVVALCLVCAILASLLGAASAYLFMRDGDSLLGNAVDEVIPTQTPVLTTASSQGAVNETAAYIYDLACQQVVGITTEITYYNIFGQTSAAVAGSGFVIQEDGYILTNYHVIEEAEAGDYEVSVVMYDGTEYIAEIVGYDEDTDLALLKIDASGLSAAELGDSENLTVGQIVYTVGNPLGELSYTMTSGIVSARDRVITTSSDVSMNMFQIDAAVNSGNSGGPVYNSQGQVIGIVTAKYSSSGVEGLGFAIPISDAVTVANQLLEYGYVTNKASLGVSVASVTASMARQYNMTQGVYITQVQEGSAADNAGIQAGDIVTAVDGVIITTTDELTSIIKASHAGDEAVFTIWRSGETMDVVVIYDERLPEEEDAVTEQSTVQNPGQGQYYYEGTPGSGNMEDFFRQFFGFGY